MTTTLQFSLTFDRGILGRSRSEFSDKINLFVGDFELCNFADLIHAQTDAIHTKGKGKTLKSIKWPL